MKKTKIILNTTKSKPFVSIERHQHWLTPLNKNSNQHFVHHHHRHSTFYRLWSFLYSFFINSLIFSTLLVDFLLLVSVVVCAFKWIFQNIALVLVLVLHDVQCAFDFDKQCRFLSVQKRNHFWNSFLFIIYILFSFIVFFFVDSHCVFFFLEAFGSV